MAQTLVGQLYSRVYLERGAPTRDSQRFRSRLAHIFDAQFDALEHDVFRLLSQELGADIALTPAGYLIGDFIRECHIHDLLDTVSLVWRAANNADQFRTSRGNAAKFARPWREFVSRALVEENAGYRIDEAGGVHPVVDQEFDHNRAATVAMLQHSGLGNALQEHEAAYGHFERQHQDTKAAVRSIFETVEILAKLICPQAQRLNKQLIDGPLKAACLPLMAQDPTEQRVMGAVFDTLDEWATGFHNYRHGQGQPDPVAPSEQLTVWALSTGSAYVRLLAECYGKLHPV